MCFWFRHNLVHIVSFRRRESVGIKSLEYPPYNERCQLTAQINDFKNVGVNFNDVFSQAFSTP